MFRSIDMDNLFFTYVTCDIPAGPHLDEWIERIVMGREVSGPVPSYSTDTNIAWKVAEGVGLPMVVETNFTRGEQRLYRVRFGNRRGRTYESFWEGNEAEAVCRAALNAKLGDAVRVLD